MFEKQYAIKDITTLKNKIRENTPKNYVSDIIDNYVVIKNQKGKVVFNGEITSNPVGCKVVGDFVGSKSISIAASIIVALYIIFLLISFTAGLRLYDFQIFLMVVAAAAIVILRKISDSKEMPVKNIFEDIN